MNVYNSCYILEFLDKFNETDSSLNSFLDKYLAIIKMDKKKPLFSLTNRYSSFPKHKTDRYKRHNLKKGENAWMPNTNNKNINKIIKGILNKISEKNYVKCTIELIKNIEKINNFDLFDILAEEIYQKCIYDIKYHPMFIYLCKNIWDSEKIVLNTVTIGIKDNKYFWKKNKENSKSHGPFLNKSDTHDDIYSNINFQSILINIFIREFSKRNELFNNNKCEDTEMNFKNKYTIQSIFKFIISLYKEDLIDSSYLDILFDNIINTTIYEEDIESIYKIIKLIPFPKYEKLEYYLDDIEMKKSLEWSKRTLFFFNEIYKFKEVNISSSIEYDAEYFINAYLNNKIDFNKLAFELKKVATSCETIVYLILEDNKNYKKYYNILNDLYKFKKIYRKDILFTINKIVSEYDDISIDVPNLHSYLSQFINLISNDVSFTFCNNKFITNLKSNIKDNVLRAKFAVSILNKVDRISDHAFEQLLSIVDRFKSDGFKNDSTRVESHIFS